MTLPNASFKATPEDFVVDELLGFAPDGEGSHLWLNIEKRLWNTLDVQRFLAEQLNVERHDVGYSGLKDKVAVTRQWFSVPVKNLPELEWPQGMQLVEAVAHNKKLRIGTHKTNRFSIRLTEVSDVDALLEQWQRCCSDGALNDFGDQRFGNNNRNLDDAEYLLLRNGKIKARNKRSLALSAARAWLFNQMAQDYVLRFGHQLVDGAWLMLAGTRSVFIATEPEREQNLQRLASGDVQLAIPLLGERLPAWTGEAKVWLDEQVEKYQPWLDGLARCRMDAEPRALLVKPTNPQVITQDADSVTLSFELPRGCFATAVLAQCANLTQVRASETPAAV